MLERALYYTAERVTLGLVEALSGRRMRMERLDRVRLVPFGSRRPRYLAAIAKRLERDFRLPVETSGPRATPRDAVEWGSHLFVPRAAEALDPDRRRGPAEALLGVTPYPLSVLPPVGLARELYRFHAILGVALPASGIAMVSTLGDRLGEGPVAETAAHEVAHLRGLHGWPLWRC
ncbi:MAG: hypothetical protein HY558_05045 [Euryarchaeota archaeon]|nr:hypothetical protein [Euryarchaeota archaeon]